MELEKMVNFLGNTPNQPLKCRTKNWFEINENPCGTHNTNTQIKFKTRMKSMIKWSLWDDSDAYILANKAVAGALANNSDKKVVFKNTQTDCIREIRNTQIDNAKDIDVGIREIRNTQIDNAKDIDVAMLMYNLIECSDDHSKTSGSLWKYCRYEPTLTAGAINDFPGNSASFKFKQI